MKTSEEIKMPGAERFVGYMIDFLVLATFFYLHLMANLEMPVDEFIAHFTCFGITLFLARFCAAIADGEILTQEANSES